LLPHDAERLCELLFFSKYSSAQALSVCSKKITGLIKKKNIPTFWQNILRQSRREQCYDLLDSELQVKSSH